MILGERDRERVNTAEIQVSTLEQQLADAKRKLQDVRREHANAEARLLAEMGYAEQLVQWGQGLAVEAGEQLAAAHARTTEALAWRDGAFTVLTDLATTLRDLHTEADGAPVCRHCGHAYPCPTLGALPSSP